MGELGKCLGFLVDIIHAISLFECVVNTQVEGVDVTGISFKIPGLPDRLDHVGRVVGDAELLDVHGVKVQLLDHAVQLQGDSRAKVPLKKVSDERRLPRTVIIKTVIQKMFFFKDISYLSM